MLIPHIYRNIYLYIHCTIGISTQRFIYHLNIGVTLDLRDESGNMIQIFPSN